MVAPVLRKNIAHRTKRYGQCDVHYMAMVSKWRVHFYDIILDALADAGIGSPPIGFAPLERYMDGFTVEYHDITDLPQDFLADLRSAGETNEGWNVIEDGTIYIFYDPHVHPNRQRFTRAHEWGHVLQKLDGEFKASMEAVSDSSDRAAIIESVANHIAAFYLIPNPLLEREFTHAVRQGTAGPSLALGLARRFSVSETAMTNAMMNYRPVRQKR